MGSGRKTIRRPFELEKYHASNSKSGRPMCSRLLNFGESWHSTLL